MKLSQFDFELPQEKIATELMPEVDGHVQWRDECKLMVLHKDTGEIEHRQFKDIIDYFANADTDSAEEALRVLGEDEYTMEEIRIMRIKYLSDVGN